ncbi:hypothetical protein M569_08897, partial [Genlisea aurea]
KNNPPPPPPPESLIKERHKYFDEAVITVRAGDGGHGAVLNLPKSQSAKEKQKKKKISYKRDFDGSLILPRGGQGGDVVIYADRNEDTLLEFHNKGGGGSRFSAKRGGNVDATGVLSSQIHDGVDAPSLRIPVPLGTVVKLKRGKLLADLANPGDEVVVARGGQGGISLADVPENRRKKVTALTSDSLRDENDKFLLVGQLGEEVNLQLILRVVADVGLVGLPNAGKSTLLSAITMAKPDIADYPFTTLMPNLGRLNGDDPTLNAATLADLPGLIEGAHLGKGLGRNFLRHLRRTRVLVHVVDAAAEDPVQDYLTVKEELRMYNPEYLERPYVVVLNKIDIPAAMERIVNLTEEIQKIGVAEQADQTSSRSDESEKKVGEFPRPVAVVAVSVLKGFKIDEMLKEIRSAL